MAELQANHLVIHFILRKHRSEVRIYYYSWADVSGFGWFIRDLEGTRLVIGNLRTKRSEE